MYHLHIYYIKKVIIKITKVSSYLQSKFSKLIHKSCVYIYINQDLYTDFIHSVICGKNRK
jgi:hypothetical protein